MNGLQLRDWRLGRGLSQIAMASDYGCALRSIRSYEQAVDNPIPRPLHWYVIARTGGCVLPIPAPPPRRVRQPSPEIV